MTSGSSSFRGDLDAQQSECIQFAEFLDRISDSNQAKDHSYLAQAPIYTSGTEEPSLFPLLEDTCMAHYLQDTGVPYTVNLWMAAG